MESLRSAISVPTSLLLVLLTFCSLGFSQKPPGAAASDELRPGVVVEEVKEYWGAEQGGLQAEDILLEWSRGDAHGRIESPFDLTEIEIEQAARGVVTVKGLRGNERKAWALGPTSWGMKVRPNFPDSLLSLYREGQ